MCEKWQNKRRIRNHICINVSLGKEGDPEKVALAGFIGTCTGG